MIIKLFTANLFHKSSGSCLYAIGLVLFIAVSGMNIRQTQAQSPFPPPSQLQVYANQELAFGSFFAGTSGGTVTISPTGTRSVSGTVIELAQSPGSPAIFDLRLVPGRIVHIVFPGSAQLVRKGGGGVLMLTDFTTDKPGNSFVTTAAHPFINPVQVGATLNVRGPNENESGDYMGTFNVTFIQE